MLRQFNAREGIDEKADKLPKKFFKALTGSGPTAGMALPAAELEQAKQEYYRQSGWDPKTGNPTRQTLDRLGLEWAA
jgi:aldehyde:ferredoxin oxidoreductase